MSTVKLQNRTIKFGAGTNFHDEDGNYKGTSNPTPNEGPAAVAFRIFSTHKRVDSKISVGYVTPGHIALGDPRQESFSKGGDLFLFDFDGSFENHGIGEPESWVRAKLAGLKERGISYFCATSFSHGKKSKEGHFRGRIGICADRTVRPSEWSKVWIYWAAFFEGRVDKAPRNHVSVFHEPACPVACSRAWSEVFLDGDCFSVEEALQNDFNDLLVFDRISKEDRIKKIESFAAKRAPEGDELDPGTPIETSKRGTIFSYDVGEGEKIPCFCPWRNEKNPSAFIARKGGRVYVHDSGSRETRYFPREGVPSKMCHLSSLIRKKTTSGTTTEEKIDKKYVSDLLGDLSGAPSEYHLVRAPLGAGKTWWAARQAERFRTVCCLIDTVALSRACSKDFNLTEYSETKSSTVDRLCTTTHSAHRFDVPCDEDLKVGWDLSIGDEIVGVANAWVSPILRGMGQIAKEETLRHLTSGGTSVLLSADFTDEMMDLFESFIKTRDKNAVIHRHIVPVVLGSRTIVLTKARQWKKEMIQSCLFHKIGSAPQVILTTSTSSPHVWAEQVKKERPDLRILAVSSENSDTHEIRAILADPDQILRDYDLIFLSPSVKAGFSFSLPVSKVWGSFTGGLTARDFAQMLLRVRNPQDINLKVTVTESKGEWQTSEKYLLGLAVKKSKETESFCDNAVIQYRIDHETGERTPLDMELLKVWTHFERERRLTENNRLGEFLQKAEYHGWNVTTAEEMEVTEEEAAALAAATTEAREALDGARVERLLEAPVITEKQAEEIGKAHVKTLEEKSAAERYRIEDFYNENISKDLIEKDKKGKTRKAIRQGVLLRRWQAGQKEAAVCKDLKNTAKKQITEYAHFSLRTKKFDEIIRMGLGCSLEEFEGQKITRESLTESFQDWLSESSNRQSVQEVLGSSCTAQTALNPSKWFLELTKKAGAEWTATRRREGDGWVREYTLSLSSFRELSKGEESRVDSLIEEFKDSSDFDLKMQELLKVI